MSDETMEAGTGQEVRIEKLRYYAAARKPRARKVCYTGRGTKEFKIGWMPTCRGRHVGIAGEPSVYETEEEAVAASARFIEAIRTALSKEARS